MTEFRIESQTGGEEALQLLAAHQHELSTILQRDGCIMMPLLVWCKPNCRLECLWSDITSMCRANCNLFTTTMSSVLSNATHTMELHRYD